MKIQHDANVENIVSNVYAKVDDDRLWNEKALVLTTTATTRRTTPVALGDLFSGLRNNRTPDENSCLVVK